MVLLVLRSLECEVDSMRKIRFNLEDIIFLIKFY